MEQNRTILDKAAGPFLVVVWLSMPTIGYLGGVPTANLTLGSMLFGAILLMGYLLAKRIATEMGRMVAVREGA